MSNNQKYKWIIQLVGCAFVGAGGLLALWLGETDVASFCFGGIVGYVLKNGTQYVIENKKGSQ